MYWSTSSGLIELNITKRQADSASHPGPCDDDVFALSQVPAVRRQLNKVDPATLRADLKEYGACVAEELADHEQNLQRLLWLAAGDINEGI